MEGKHEQFFQLDRTITAHLGTGGAGSSLNFHLIQHSLFQSHVGNMPAKTAEDSTAPKSVRDIKNVLNLRLIIMGIAFIVITNKLFEFTKFCIEHLNVSALIALIVLAGSKTFNRNITDGVAVGCEGKPVEKWNDFLQRGCGARPGNATQATTVVRGSNRAAHVLPQEALDYLQEVFDEGMQYISGFQSPADGFSWSFVFFF